jgi:hypothetical protein
MIRWQHRLCCEADLPDASALWLTLLQGPNQREGNEKDWLVSQVDDQ